MFSDSMFKLPRKSVSGNAAHDGVVPERVAGRIFDSLARKALTRVAGQGESGMAPAVLAPPRGPTRRDWPGLTATDRHWRKTPAARELDEFWGRRENDGMYDFGTRFADPPSVAAAHEDHGPEAARLRMGNGEPYVPTYFPSAGLVDGSAWARSSEFEESPAGGADQGNRADGTRGPTAPAPPALAMPAPAPPAPVYVEGQPKFYQQRGETQARALAQAAFYWNDPEHSRWPADGSRPPAAEGIPRLELDPLYLAADPQEMMKLSLFLRLVDQDEGSQAAGAGDEWLPYDDPFWETPVGILEHVFRLAYEGGEEHRKRRKVSTIRALKKLDNADGWRHVHGGPRLGLDDHVDVRDADELGENRGVRNARRRARNFLNGLHGQFDDIAELCGRHLV